MAGSASRPKILIAGGGPAGLMLGFLLARAGLQVTVLEKHGDFLRDFRGDTIHASTLELMYELGLGDEFLKLPHQKVARFTGRFGNEEVAIGDFTHLPTRAKYVAFVPQWDFLDFIADQGRRYPGFDLRMNTKAQRLLRDPANGRVTGIAGRDSAGGKFELAADLVVACDGRHSELRAQLVAEPDGPRLVERGAPIDVLWFRVAREGGDAENLLGHVDAGRALVLINRGDYFQCAYIIPKGRLPLMQQQGLERFRAGIVALAPFLAGRIDALRSWDDVKLLTVRVNRLETWHRPGLLCIGDAAHAMSPVGGVGINLAIQDAVATANILWRAMRDSRVLDDVLPAVQARRETPTRLIQGFQVMAQNFLARRYLNRMPGDGGPVRAPLPVRLLTRFPLLQRLPARFIALGPRPEHIETPDIHPRA